MYLVVIQSHSEAVRFIAKQKVVFKAILRQTEANKLY